LTDREQVAVTSRVFCIAAVIGIALVSRDTGALAGVAAVLVVGALSVYLSRVTGGTRLVTLTAETVLVAVVMGLTFPGSIVLMPYLVVLSLLAGLLRRLPGVLLVTVALVVGILVVPLAAHGLHGMGSRAVALAPWLLTNVGGGLIGVWARNLGHAKLSGDSDAQ
jgi:hypothetical protein